MHWLAKKFLRINQITLDEKMILCCHCEEYLGTVIWNTVDGKNTCDDCKESTKCYTYNRNWTLELALSQFKYPCSSPPECHFIDTFENAKEHSKSCTASFKCNYCESVVNIDNTTEHYLEQHCRKKLFASHEGCFDKIVLILPLKTEEKQRIHILRAGFTDFILFINILAENTCSVGIAKHQDFQCPQFSRATQDEFVIEWKNKQTGESRKLSGVTSTIRDYFAGSANSKQITMTMSTLLAKKQRVQVTIAFNGYKAAKGVKAEKWEKTSCPVCFDDQELLICKTRCKNQHSLCMACSKLIDACPFCREPMDIPLGIIEQFPNLLPKPQLRHVQCAHTHCLKVVREDRLAAHLPSCAFEDAECPECEKPILQKLPRMKLLEHLQKAHRKFLQSNEFYVQPSVAVRHHYFLFKGHLFQLAIGVADAHGVRAVCFRMQLRLEDDVPPDGFRYEVHFHERPSDIIAVMKVGNVCQADTDEMFSVTLEAKSVPRVQGDDESLAFVRVYLFSTTSAVEEAVNVVTVAPVTKLRGRKKDKATWWKALRF